MKLSLVIVVLVLSGCAGSPAHNALLGNGFVCTMSSCVSKTTLSSQPPTDDVPTRIGTTATMTYDIECRSDLAYIQYREHFNYVTSRYNLPAIAAGDWDDYRIQRGLTDQYINRCLNDAHRRAQHIEWCTSKMLNEISAVQDRQKRYNIPVTPTNQLLSERSCSIR